MTTESKSVARKAAKLMPIEGLRMYKLTELETILGVTHRTLLNYVYDGKLKAIKIGQRWKVSEDEVRRFISEQEHNVPHEVFYQITD